MNLDDIRPGMELVADLRDGRGPFMVTVTNVWRSNDLNYPVEAREHRSSYLGLYRLDELSLP